MKPVSLHKIGPFFGFALFILALTVLHHELKIYHFHEIVGGIHSISGGHLSLAILATFFSYLVMCGYDALALAYIRHPIPYARIFLASFIGSAFSNNMGFAMVAGGSVRFRFYSAWGLSALEIAKVVTFCAITLWVGFFALGGIVFISEPMIFPGIHHFPFTSTRIIGVFFLILLCFYLWLTFTWKKPIKFKEWEFSLPRPIVIVPQIVISMADWVLAGSVLYLLLPNSSDLTWFGFMGIYMLAQLSGMASQLPGGIGVFETVIITALSSKIPASHIMGSLVVYRGIYYICPLLFSLVLLGGRELIQKKEALKNVAQFFGRWMSAIVPPLFSVAIFLGGIILLLSAVTPAVHWRITGLNKLLPLPVIEVTHFLGSLVGVMLLILSRSIQRRIDSAYLVTLFLLGTGILFSLLKGLDFEESIVLMIMLIFLLPCRRYFYRKGSLISDRFGPGWTVAIALVFVSATWLGLFSYKHIEYSNDLWWRFSLHGDAPRFLRAMVGMGAFGFIFVFAHLLKPSRPKVKTDHMADIQKAASIVVSSTRSSSSLALLGDKSFLFNEKENAFIMYGIERRSWIAMGDPVGPKDEWPELIWQFYERCNEYGGWAVFYEIAHQNLFYYVDMGLSLLKLGEQGRVLLEDFSLEGSSRKGLRYTCHKLEKQGCVFSVIPPEKISSILPELKEVSDSWLERKNVKEKKFSLGFFDENYLQYFPIGIVQVNGKIMGFANIWQGAYKKEISIDLMRYRPDSPNGLMEHLFIQLMMWAKQNGFQWFNMGMAPFSGFENHELAPLWNRLGAYIFQHGEHFYNLKGLRRFKAKFDPVWEPRYLASPGGLALPRILIHIATLISGNIDKVLVK